MSPPFNLFMFSEEDGISINEEKKILIQKKC